MRLKAGSSTIARSRRLRREMTLPELLLWRELRKQGVRWRKQCPAGPYSLDFYCAPASLAVEVDGEAHDRGDRPERDAARDAWLLEEGVATLRISAADVLRNLEGVIRLILAQVAARLPPPPPA